MFIHVQPNSNTPIYAQIVEQIKHSVASGVAQAGEQLPSVRELAMRLRINPNTVARAYRELETENIVHTRKGKGVYVAAPCSTLTSQEKERLVGEKLERALVEALTLGLTFDDVRDILEKSIATFSEERVNE